MQHGGFAKGREEALLVRGPVERGGVMFKLSDDFFGDFRYMHSQPHEIRTHRLERVHIPVSSDHCSALHARLQVNASSVASAPFSCFSPLQPWVYSKSILACRDTFRPKLASQAPIPSSTTLSSSQVCCAQQTDMHIPVVEAPLIAIYST